MKTRPYARAALVAALASVAAAAPAAAHNVTPTVSCSTARFVYTDNARGEQRAIETVTVDGVTVYGPAERRWTSTSRSDTFDVPLTIYGGPRTVSTRVEFTGSDGYRYARTVSAVVTCGPEPVPPTAPEPPAPVPTPEPPVPATPPPPPAPPATPPAKPRPPVKPRPPLPRPTVCRTYVRKPANAITRGVPRPGQIRVRRVGGEWVGYRGDRFVRVQIRGRAVVLFVPGVLCGTVVVVRVTG